MRITILTLGSYGDVQPFIPLGVGLQKAGHEVLIATHESFGKLILSYGLQFFPLGVDPRQVLSTEEGRAWVNSGQNPLRFIRFFIRVMRPRLKMILEDAWNACQGSDVIFFSRLGVVGYHIAEKLGLPSFMVALQPFIRTRYFSCEGIEEIPPWFPFREQLNWLSHLIVEQVFWLPFRDLFNQWRQDYLKLRPIPISGPYEQMIRQQHPILFGFSSSIIPKPPDWGENLFVTGYWFLNHSPDWSPPDQLVDFIDSGSRPISIGFGSMQDYDPEELFDIVMKALGRSRKRAVLLTGWTGLRNYLNSDQIFALDEVPHSWLFPKMAAIVHHGGAGTTAAGLRAGIPNIIIPYFADQSFWGKRVVSMGVGPQPIPRRKLNVERLASAINLATTDKIMRAKAIELGRQIEAEDGVALAVEAFQQYMNHYRNP